MTLLEIVEDELFKAEEKGELLTPEVLLHVPTDVFLAIQDEIMNEERFHITTHDLDIVRCWKLRVNIAEMEVTFRDEEYEEPHVTH